MPTSPICYTVHCPCLLGERTTEVWHSECTDKSRMQHQHDFTELLQADLPTIRRFVLRRVADHFEAEDIVQETAIKAFIHFTEFRGEATFKTWLGSIARNEIRSRHRRESTSRVSYIEADKLDQMVSAGPTDSPYHQYQKKERRRILEDVVGSLRASERDVVRLRALDGCGVADAARRLSISTSATKTRYHRGLHHLYMTLARRAKSMSPSGGTGSVRKGHGAPTTGRQVVPKVSKTPVQSMTN